MENSVIINNKVISKFLTSGLIIKPIETVDPKVITTIPRVTTGNTDHDEEIIDMLIDMKINLTQLLENTIEGYFLTMSSSS
jgi:hypothetical protein